jgi:hypothetical protein
VASAGGKISLAVVEVQPGATLFLQEYHAVRQEINSGTPVLSLLGAIWLYKKGFLLRKGAKKRYYKKIPTRCNLFAKNGLHLICFVE